MSVVRLAVAACVLLVLTACGAGRAGHEVRQGLSTPSLSAAAAERSDYVTREKVTRSIGDDVTLVVSTPKSFTPTQEAYPKAARAVAFELVIDNKSAAVYRPAQLSFVATADGSPVDQVIDTTQGYSGVTGTADEVQPRQTMRFSVAFGVPKDPCSMRVAVRAASSDSTISIYDGTV